MPAGFSEDDLVEKPTLALLEQLGYETINAYEESYGPESPSTGNPGRDDRSEVILKYRLRPKLAELNPDLPAQARVIVKCCGLAVVR
jgi:type I restriction enzyme R subunit